MAITRGEDNSKYTNFLTNLFYVPQAPVASLEPNNLDIKVQWVNNLDSTNYYVYCDDPTVPYKTVSGLMSNDVTFTTLDGIVQGNTYSFYLRHNPDSSVAIPNGPYKPNSISGPSLLSNAVYVPVPPPTYNYSNNYEWTNISRIQPTNPNNIYVDLNNGRALTSVWADDPMGNKYFLLNCMDNNGDLLNTYNINMAGWQAGNASGILSDGNGEYIFAMTFYDAGYNFVYNVLASYSIDPTLPAPNVGNLYWCVRLESSATPFPQLQRIKAVEKIGAMNKFWGVINENVSPSQYTIMMFDPYTGNIYYSKSFTIDPLLYNGMYLSYSDFSLNNNDYATVFGNAYDPSYANIPFSASAKQYYPFKYIGYGTSGSYPNLMTSFRDKNDNVYSIIAVAGQMYFIATDSTNTQLWQTEILIPGYYFQDADLQPLYNSFGDVTEFIVRTASNGYQFIYSIDATSGICIWQRYFYMSDSTGLGNYYTNSQQGCTSIDSDNKKWYCTGAVYYTSNTAWSVELDVSTAPAVGLYTMTNSPNTDRYIKIDYGYSTINYGVTMAFVDPTFNLLPATTNCFLSSWALNQPVSINKPAYVSEQW